MNIVMRAGLAALLGFAVLPGLAGGVATAADKPEDLALVAAESWLAIVDQGRHGASWDAAARLFKEAVTREQWEQAAAAARKPLGDLVSRKVASREYAESLPGAPDGRYVVIRFDTRFKSKTAAVETVTAMLDPDGAWRISGYFIK